MAKQLTEWKRPSATINIGSGTFYWRHYCNTEAKRIGGHVQTNPQGMMAVFEGPKV